MDTFRRRVSKKPAAPSRETPATLAKAAPGRNEDVSFYVVGESTQELVRLAVGHGRASEFLMQSFDGHADGVRGSLRDAFCPGKILALESVELFELAQD